MSRSRWRSVGAAAALALLLGLLVPTAAVAQVDDDPPSDDPGQSAPTTDSGQPTAAPAPPPTDLDRDGRDDPVSRLDTDGDGDPDASGYDLDGDGDVDAALHDAAVAESAPSSGNCDDTLPPTVYFLRPSETYEGGNNASRFYRVETSVPWNQATYKEWCRYRPLPINAIPMPKYLRPLIGEGPLPEPARIDLPRNISEFKAAASWPAGLPKLYFGGERGSCGVTEQETGANSGYSLEWEWVYWFSFDCRSFEAPLTVSDALGLAHSYVAQLRAAGAQQLAYAETGPVHASRWLVPMSRAVVEVVVVAGANNGAPFLIANAQWQMRGVQQAVRLGDPEYESQLRAQMWEIWGMIWEAVG